MIIIAVVVLVALIGGWLIIQPRMKDTNTSSPRTVSSADLKTYEDAANNLTLEYPKDWFQKESEEGAISFGDKSGANVTMYVEDLGLAGASLEDYSATSITGLTNLGLEFNLLDSYDSTTIGYPSYTIEYTLSNESLKARATGMWFILGTKAYSFTYTAPEDLYETYKPKAMTVINSVRIENE